MEKTKEVVSKETAQPGVIPTENAASKEVIPAEQTLQRDPQDNPVAAQSDLNTNTPEPGATTLQPNILENDEQHQTIERLMKAREERVKNRSEVILTRDEIRAQRAALLADTMGQTNEIGRMLEGGEDPQAPANRHGETSPMDPNHDSVRNGPEGTQEQNPPFTLAELQEQYKSLTGKPASTKWNEQDLLSHIEKAKSA